MQLLHELAHAAVASSRGIKIAPSFLIPNSQLGTFGSVTQVGRLRCCLAPCPAEVCSLWSHGCPRCAGGAIGLCVPGAAPTHHAYTKPPIPNTHDRPPPTTPPHPPPNPPVYLVRTALQLKSMVRSRTDLFDFSAAALVAGGLASMGLFLAGLAASHGGGTPEVRLAGGEGLWGVGLAGGQAGREAVDSWLAGSAGMVTVPLGWLRRAAMPVPASQLASCQCLQAGNSPPHAFAHAPALLLCSPACCRCPRSSSRAACCLEASQSLAWAAVSHSYAE